MPARSTRQRIDDQLTCVQGNLVTAQSHTLAVMELIGYWHEGKRLEIPLSDLLELPEPKIDYADLHEQLMELHTGLQFFHDYVVKLREVF